MKETEAVNTINQVTDGSILFLPQIDNFHRNWSGLFAPRHKLSSPVARKKRRTLTRPRAYEKMNKIMQVKNAAVDAFLIALKHLPLIRSFTRIPCFFFVTFGP